MLKGNSDPISRSFRIGCALALLGGAAAWPLFGGAVAFGWIAGAAWNLANLMVLKRLMGLLSEAGEKRTRRPLFFLLALKLGFLYPVGIGLLWSGWAPAIPFAGGFTAVLIGAVAGFLVRLPAVAACD
ncbi:MAG: hypothetical protein COV76_01945 [Candidatus Omnitrophica bacterium CG11_big_fil_rev_8_21_14_0_20_64_10]|nr:MAG: hypothetical protein COV76_01945 [Candidatus Omnitrophica bacterium CG11_big_fil_rev_8_21_14_0_20_64_10]